jgi:hypothetical protein
MTGWPSAKIRRTIAATVANAVATKASLPTSSVRPRGKAGLAARRNLSASAIFFFPCRPLASGSRVNRRTYTTRNLCLAENAQQASRFPLRSRGRRYAREHDQCSRLRNNRCHVGTSRSGRLIEAYPNQRRFDCLTAIPSLRRTRLRAPGAGSLAACGCCAGLAGRRRAKASENARKSPLGQGPTCNCGEIQALLHFNERGPRHGSVACGSNARRHTGKTIAAHAK